MSLVEIEMNPFGLDALAILSNSDRFPSAARFPVHHYATPVPVANRTAH